MKQPKLADVIAVSVFGRTRGDAHEARICIKCAQPVPTGALSLEDLREYAISGLCPACFDALNPEPPE